MFSLTHKYCVFYPGDMAYIVQHTLLSGHWNFTSGAELFKFKECSKKTMSDISTCEDLLLKYCDALLTAAFDQITTEHHFNLNNRGDDNENKNFVKSLSSNLVNRFILLEVPTSNNNLLCQCEHCNKKFKRVKTLREHQNLKHKNQKIGVTDKNASDYVFHYSVNALALLKTLLTLEKMDMGKNNSDI